MTEVPARVAVLLATYNGARFLDAQMRSLAAQTVAAVDVWVSDDRSVDATRDILDDWAARWSKGTFRILDGPREGFAQNYASLLVRPEIVADHYAFCDQDDEWDEDKLERAVIWLHSFADDLPRVHCGRTRLIAENGEDIGRSTLFTRPPCFRNAIVQSIAGGNTMVMNGTARDLLAETCRRTTFVSHDWWTYMMVTGAGGVLHYDPTPAISYRQHGQNAIGANTSLAASVHRIRRMLSGGFRVWNEINLAALDSCADLLAEESRRTTADFRDARIAPPPRSLIALARSGAFRQTRLGNLALYAACATGRI